MQVFEKLPDGLTGSQVYVSIQMMDSYGRDLGFNSSTVLVGDTLGSDSELPWVMLVTPTAIKEDTEEPFLKERMDNPGGTQPDVVVYSNGPVNFAYASQSWSSVSSNCNVESWDDEDAYEPTREMTCTFVCPGT